MSRDGIDERAVVSPAAEIGPNVRIDPFVVVEEDVRIGEGTRLHAHVHVRAGTTIGRDCQLFTGAAVGSDPQDLKFGGEATQVVIGDRTTVREYSTIHRGTIATGKTVVGSDCLLMAYTHVAHDCRVGDHVILANGVQLGGHAEIGDWAILGGLVGVHQFERVGAHAMVGFGTRIVKDVPPYVLAGNEPLGFSGVNVVGLKRRGFNSESIERIREAYRMIYQAGMNIGDGVRTVEEFYPDDDEVTLIVDFIRSSQRGVIPLSR